MEKNRIDNYIPEVEYSEVENINGRQCYRGHIGPHKIYLDKIKTDNKNIKVSNPIN